MKRTNGFTLIELLIVVAIIGIIAAIAIPGLLRARMSGNEAASIGSMRSVISSQINYAATAAPGGYAPTLPRLGATCPGGNVPFLSSELTAGLVVQKSGFTFEMQAASGAGAGPSDCNGVPTAGGFYITAEAVMPGVTGGRAFAASHIGGIWENTASGTTAPAEADMSAAPTATIRPLR